MKKYIVANFKMNQDFAASQNWLEQYDKLNFALPADTHIVLAPSFVHLSAMAHSIKEKHLLTELAAQDVSAMEKGAHTGDIGAFQLREMCKFIIVGHSERKEPKDDVLAKIAVCRDNDLTPIVCFVNIDDVPYFYNEGIILAWEDPNSISVDGNYRAKSIEEVRTVVAEIRKKLPEEAVLLYGGSVNRENIADLCTIDGLNGVLVGHASLDPDHFGELVAAYL